MALEVHDRPIDLRDADPGHLYGHAMDSYLVHTRRQGETMSDPFYARALYDPLDVAGADPVVAGEIMDLSLAGLEQSMAAGRTDEEVEFGLDYLYRALPVASLGGVSDAIKMARQSVDKRLGLGETLAPTERLSLRMHGIDLAYLNVFNAYHGAIQAGTLSKEDKQRVAASLETASMVQIQRGAALLSEAQKTHEGLHDPEEKKSLRGKMFELLYMSVERLRLYSDERYDEAALLTATSFEDSSAKVYKPNHNYDVIKVDSTGNITEVVQCKNAAEGTEYQPPIQKVEGKAFGRFLERPKAYIAALNRISSNGNHFSEAQLRQDRELLESLFTAQADRVAAGVGAVATRH